MTGFCDRRPPVTGVELRLWHCPLCDLDGEVDPRCFQCHGTGFTSTIAGWEDRARLAPRPPAVMPNPCADCAFRAGSPEQEGDHDLEGLRDATKPFWCHQGMPTVNGSYQPLAWAGGVPLGYKVCGGWWTWATTGELPSKPYRELAEPEENT